ncbi:MAG: DAK2 domain-containing protein [[Clostridium] innocuum]
MSFTNKEGKLIVLNIIDTIQKHKDYLSEIDGAIGDGDHGINMNKGVTIAKSQVDKNETLSEALCTLSCVLMEKIGGSMGPLYGSIFMGMQAALGNAEYINGAIIEKMLKQAYDNIQMISPAKPGDKTLVDVLAPAVSAYASVFEKTQDTCAALTACSQAAEEGMQATCDMQAN